MTRPRSEREKARSRERANERYAKLKADPARYAALLAYNREWRKKNPGKMAEYTRAWREKNPDRWRAVWVRSKYKLTEEQYETLLKHNGRCDSCDDSVEGHRRHIDHDHDTGKFRGILCGHCNTATGYLRNDPKRAIALARYLRKFA